jgi:hypothetical protein
MFFSYVIGRACPGSWDDAAHSQKKTKPFEGGTSGFAFTDCLSDEENSQLWHSKTVRGAELACMANLLRLRNRLHTEPLQARSA